MEINRTASMGIGILGALLAMGGLAAYWVWPDHVVLYTTLLGLAAVHWIVFCITHFETFKAVSKKRSTLLGFNTVLMTALVIAILAIINFVVAQHEIRFDLSEQKSYTLSPQTVSVLKGIKEKVKISGFFRGGRQNSAKELFENYRHHSSHLEYEFIDPDRKPAVAKQYGITAYDTVVVESRGQSAMITALSEQTLTSAVIRVSRGSKKQIYFIEGHGEHSIDNTDREGYAFLKTSLENQGFAVKKLALLSEKDIPEDAVVVILGGPETAYAAEEEAMLRRYLTDGGQLLALLDPMTKNNLELFFSEWGIVVNQEIILDPSSALGPAVPIVAVNGYLSHDITRDFQMATFYSLAQSVALDPAKADTIRFDSFVQTGPQSWATKQMTSPLSLDPNRDRGGPIMLGGVFTHKSSDPKPEGETEGATDMRLVVVGDSDFATNGMIRAVGNGDLVQNMISWLAQEKDLVSIRPPETPLQTLLLSANQQAGIFYFSVVLIPIGIFVMGIAVYRKRRRL